MRNDQTIYDRVADQWWSDEVRWVRTLKNLVPGRLKWFVRHFEWPGKVVLDLGCAGGFMAEAMAERGARVTGIDPAAEAVAAARCHSSAMGLTIHYDVGVGEALPYAAAKFDAVVWFDVHGACGRSKPRAGRDCTRVAPWRVAPIRHDQPQSDRAPCHDHRGRGRTAPVAERHT